MNCGGRVAAFGSRVNQWTLLGLHTGAPRAARVTRKDISARLWGQRVFVDRDAGKRTAILKIRHVLNDTGASPRFIETVPGKGYRFIAPVEYRLAEHLGEANRLRRRRRSDGRRHNLPADLTSFVGREKPLAELRRAAFLLASAVADWLWRRGQDTAGDPVRR